MSFNTARKPAHQAVTNTTNLVGGAALKFTDVHFELYSMVAGNLVSDKFYQTQTENISKLRQLVAKSNPEFVAKLAFYARATLNLRTVALVLLVELAKVHKGNDLVARAAYHTIQRADEMAEVLAYYKAANKLTTKLKKISKQLIRGIGAAFTKFDEYQFGKYQGTRDEISLRDAMFLTHPKPSNKAMEALFKKIADKNLATPETWEVAKTKAGQTGASSKKTWEDMIASRKMGYMAVLRNLRNFLDDDISNEHLKMVTDYLVNPTAVENSKQFPFRFYSAYREILDHTNSKKDALLKAIQVAGVLSLKNMAVFDAADRVISVVDVSGSMSTPLTNMSTVKPIEIGLFYGAILQRLNPNCRLSYFGTGFGFETNLHIDPFSLPVAHNKLSAKFGHSTNAHRVFTDLLAAQHQVDKVIVFTDCQFWNSGGIHKGGRAIGNDTFAKAWEDYKKFAPKCKLFLMDLVGYGGSTPCQVKDDVFYVSGFSMETFKTLGNMSNPDIILSEIEAVELGPIPV